MTRAIEYNIKAGGHNDDIVLKMIKIGYVVATVLLVFGVVKFFAPSTLFYKQASDHVYTKGNIKAEDVSKVENCIDCLPPVLKTKFLEEGWIVCITNNIEGKVVGRTVLEDKAVYIKAEYIHEELVHEFYHIYLYEHPIGDDFKELYESEAKDMMLAYFGDDSEYKYSDVTEFYCSAAGVVGMLQGVDKLNVAPKTFAYFTELFNKLYEMG